MLLAALVSDIGRSFDRQLAEWRTRYAERPTREMVRLCLLALEREENVAVAYDHVVLSRRLALMSLPDSVRELFAQALTWVWKTEEMHAVYVRGALRRLGQPLLNACTCLQQVAGAVGGWTVSVRQHRRWSEAPLSQAAATFLTAAGGVTGRVPREVRRHLRYSSFRDFCRYNIDTEGTAWACWQRLTELAAQVPLLSGGRVADFRRIADDEECHGRVFAILADALTDDDRLREGLSEDELAAQLGAVGESFLPYPRRRQHAAGNPIGSGAPVFVVDGGTHGNARAQLRELLRGAGLLRIIQERARAGGKCAASLRIAVTTHLTNGREACIATTAELLEELVVVLRQSGAAEIAMLAGGSAARWRNGGSRDLDAERRHACAAPHYSLVDCAAEQVAHPYSRGIGQYTIARTWRDADVRIVFGEAGDPAIESTLSAVECVGGPHGHARSPEQQADRETAIMMVLNDFPPHFCLLSGSGRSGGASRPRSARRSPLLQWLYASEDALALDGVAARHLGAGNPRNQRVRRSAAQWFGQPLAPYRAERTIRLAPVPDAL